MGFGKRNADSDGIRSSVKSSISLTRLRAHRLPWATLWGIVLLTSIGVALANFCIIWATWFINRARHVAFQAFIDMGGPAAGIAEAVVVFGFLGGAAAFLVAFVAPVCAGGGLPELNSFLNGGASDHMFSLKAFMVRVFGLVLATSAGFPIGREGPTITMGGNIGYGIVHLLAVPHMRRWINMDASSDGFLPAMIVDEERLAYAKRMGCTIGGAAGMAVIFNAPIGGLLYMVEEVSVASWSSEMTLQAIMCTVLTCLATEALLNSFGDHVQQFVIWADGPDIHLWGWQDLPVIVIFAALLGLLSTVYMRALTGVFALRRQAASRRRCLGRRLPRLAKVLEASGYAALCALVFCVLTFFTRCQKEEVWGIEEGIEMLCRKGEFNPIATLLIKPPEDGLKSLYSRMNTSVMSTNDLALVLVAYTALNIGMMGIAVPMGSFIPFMFVGAVAGRLLGHGLSEVGLATPFAEPGFYALVGSAALLAGSLRQTLSVVVFLTECVNHLGAIPPLMLAVFVSHVVSMHLSPHGLDEQLIVAKGLPYLDAEPPSSLASASVTAADLCAPLPSAARLAPRATVAAVRHALESCEGLSVFPVVDGRACVGLVTRKRLRSALGCRVSAAFELSRRALGATNAARGDEDREHSAREEGAPELPPYMSQFFHTDSLAAGVDICRPDDVVLPVHRVMDASPYVLLCNTPAPRVYPLFARLGVSAACVVDSRGEFHSVLTREMVIEKSVHAHEGPGAHDPSGRWPASDEDLEAGGGSEGESVASDTVSALSSFDDKSRRVAMLEDRVRQLEALLQQQPAFGSSVGTVSSLAEQAALAASPRSEKCSAESLAPEPVETGGGACRSGAGVPISL